MSLSSKITKSMNSWEALNYILLSCRYLPFIVHNNQRFSRGDLIAESMRDRLRMNTHEAIYLFSICTTAKHQMIEIGRAMGGSTILMNAANPEVPLISIDDHGRDDNIFQHNARHMSKYLNTDNINLCIADSQTYITPKIYDLVFVDGDHSFEGCLRDLNNWWPNLAQGGSVLIHDYYDHPDHGVCDAVDKFIEECDNCEVVVKPKGRSYTNLEVEVCGSLVHLRKQ